MSLKEIFCQDRAISILQCAFAAGKSAHAYIFAGIEGIGKFKTAREWGKFLLCESPVIEKEGQEQFSDSCGVCEACRLFEAGSHPDLNLVYKELREFTREGKGKAAPVDLPVDVIREFLVEKVSVKPVLSQRKVFIVSEAENLNTASQNSLLKVLEEPPVYCCIILLCTRLEKLLPTIKSRCQTIRFAVIDEERILEKLEEAGIGRARALYFARLAGGSLGIALRWVKLEGAGVNLFEIKKELVSSLVSFEYPEALELAGRFLEESKEVAAVWSKLEEETSKTDINRRAVKTIVRMFISVLWDVMKLKVEQERELINFDQKEQIAKLAGRFTPAAAAEKIIDGCRAMLWIDSAVNERLIFEQLLLNLGVSDTMKV